MKNIQNREHSDLCVGIDLGTTNSVLATINKKPNGDIISKVVDIPRFGDIYSSARSEKRFTTIKKPTLPSCVYYREERNYEPVVGDFAKVQYPLRPHLVAKSIKSQMGNSEVDGLSYDIPDQKPEQVSARILQHLISGAEKIYKCDIDDAVITVPANFDSAMCKATRDAAEIAGIKVRNSDGTERPVLLSEPNAVIYDLVNQIKNGEISDYILDLSDKKNVMVFDIGGGTLDITMHEIKRKDDDNEILQINEIATNRYTRLGGDDFDEKIAESMYQGYLDQYQGYPDAIKKIRKEKESIMAQLRVYAENLKIDVNSSSETFVSGWDYEDEEEIFSVGGNMGGIGYSYDDSFTKEDIENILDTFMGNQLKFEDYRNLEKISDTRNIIFPILDVLKKASDKFSGEDVKVDAVVVNGGMSKFYMVIDRLRDFFGFDPIVALDPDQSVARGAAIYHYYLHEHEELQNSMIKTGVSDSSRDFNSYEEESDSSNEEVYKEDSKERFVPVEWGKTILNDALYLGAKNGAVEMIIPTGAELPYKSKVMTGYKIEPYQNIVSVPIKSRNIDGSYRTMGTGKMRFSGNYPDGAYVAFDINMNSNKVITIDAWTSYDIDGEEEIEHGTTTIDTSEQDNKSLKGKIVSPEGATLVPTSEIHNLEQLCKNLNSCNMKHIKSGVSKKISSAVDSICKAGNKADFAEVIIKHLENTKDQEFKLRLMIISRKICNSWSKENIRKLVRICKRELSSAAYGFTPRGPRTSVVIQTIYALGVCGDKNDEDILMDLHNDSRYKQALLYAHSRTQTNTEWIVEIFNEDLNKLRNDIKNSLPASVYALGVALRKDNNRDINSKLEKKIVNNICSIVSSRRLGHNELVCCILALGWICDQRYNSKLSSEVAEKVFQLINSLEKIYSDEIVKHTLKSRIISNKMLTGKVLTDDEEEFLLTKLEQ